MTAFSSIHSLLRDGSRRPVRSAAIPSGEERGVANTEPIPTPEAPLAQDSFISRVMAMDSAPEPRRGGEEFTHLSSLLSGCVRREALNQIMSGAGMGVREVRVMGAMRVVWALGRAAENYVREQFIRASDHGGILGVWYCRCRQLSYRGMYGSSLDISSCSVCGTRADRYSEYSILNLEAALSGSPDFLYVIDPSTPVPAIRVVEIKSMAREEFLSLERPVVDHCIQASGYHCLLEMEVRYGSEEHPFSVDSHVAVVYVCKDFTVRPYKEFVVDPRRFSLDVERIFEGARLVRDVRQAVLTQRESGGVTENGPSISLPLRLSACHSPESGRAKGCDSCALCFSMPNEVASLSPE